MYAGALQAQISKSYLDNQRIARLRWFETLYSYVSADKRRRIADEPIAAAEASYEKTKGQVGLVYLALFVVLAGFGIATLIKGAPPSTDPPAAAAPPPPASAAPAPGSPAAASSGAPPPKPAGRPPITPSSKP